MTDKALEERIVELEVKLSFQDSTIEALNMVIKAQQDQLDKILAALEAIKDRLSSERQELDPSFTKPPHY